MPKSLRSRFATIVAILVECKSPKTLNAVCLRVHVGYHLGSEVLELLEGAGCVSRSVGGDKVFFGTTRRGLEVVSKWEELHSLAERLECEL